MKALGIDIGSSSIKGAVLDLDSALVGTPVTHMFPAPVSGLPVGWFEVDPFEVCHATQNVLSSLCEQAPDAELLCISAQMGGLILIDDRSEPLTNYISWRDQRTLEPLDGAQPYIEHVRQCWQAANLLSELGNELQAGSTAALMGWFSRKGMVPQHAQPATIGDFVIARLVGHPVPMHATQAIGMLDLQQSQWHRPALHELGLDDPKLPELQLDEQCVGVVKFQQQSLRVFGAYGDQQCALRGAKLQTGELSLNISTGSQVSRRVSHFQPGPFQSRKYFFGDTLDTVTHLPAGRSLNVLVDLLTELARAQNLSLQDPWATITQLIANVSDTDLSVNPALFPGPTGERGVIENISTDNLNVGTLFHATFRSMADNYASVAERFAPASWSQVVLTGGLTQRAPRLRELLQERFSSPIRESVGEETLAGLLDIARNATASSSVTKLEASGIMR